MIIQLEGDCSISQNQRAFTPVDVVEYFNKTELFFLQNCEERKKKPPWHLWCKRCRYQGHQQDVSFFSLCAWLHFQQTCTYLVIITDFSPFSFQLLGSAFSLNEAMTLQFNDILLMFKSFFCEIDFLKWKNVSINELKKGFLQTYTTILVCWQI